jgi:cysteine-S-conjugate beta-lyase
VFKVKELFDATIERRGTDSVKWDGLKDIYGEADLLPLWVADMDFQVAEPIVKAIKEKVDNCVFGYPTVPDSLYASIIEWCKKRHGWELEQGWITFTSGVVPALSTIINAFTNPGDKIIIQSPVYPPFKDLVIKNDRTLIENPLKLQDQYYKMDFADLEEKIDEHVKLIIICSPHNPVGRVWKNDELQKLAEICLKHNILMVSDEIHSDLIYTGHKHIPLASLSPKIAQQTITCIAPSKTFNLAGLQTAMTIIPNENLRKKFNEYKIRQGVYFTNTLGLVATEAAYSEGGAWLDELLEYVAGNLAFLNEYIEEELPEIQVIQPEGTYLVWLDFRELKLNEKELARFMVEKAKVALNDGYKFGPGGGGFIRMNLACSRSILEEALQRIERAIKQLQ